MNPLLVAAILLLPDVASEIKIGADDQKFYFKREIYAKLELEGTQDGKTMTATQEHWVTASWTLEAKSDGDRIAMNLQCDEFSVERRTSGGRSDEKRWTLPKEKRPLLLAVRVDLRGRIVEMEEDSLPDALAAAGCGTGLAIAAQRLLFPPNADGQPDGTWSGGPALPEKPAKSWKLERAMRAWNGDDMIDDFGRLAESWTWSLVEEGDFKGSLKGELEDLKLTARRKNDRVELTAKSGAATARLDEKSGLVLSHDRKLSYEFTGTCEGIEVKGKSELTDRLDWK